MSIGVPGNAGILRTPSLDQKYVLLQRSAHTGQWNVYSVYDYHYTSPVRGLVRQRWSMLFPQLEALRQLHAVTGKEWEGDDIVPKTGVLDTYYVARHLINTEGIPDDALS